MGRRERRHGGPGAWFGWRGFSWPGRGRGWLVRGRGGGGGGGPGRGRGGGRRASGRCRAGGRFRLGSCRRRSAGAGFSVRGGGVRASARRPTPCRGCARRRGRR